MPPKPRIDPNEWIHSAYLSQRWGTFGEVINALGEVDDVLWTSKRVLGAFRGLAGHAFKREDLVAEVEEQRKIRAKGRTTIRDKIVAVDVTTAGTVMRNRREIAEAAHDEQPQTQSEQDHRSTDADYGQPSWINETFRSRELPPLTSITSYHPPSTGQDIQNPSHGSIPMQVPKVPSPKSNTHRVEGSYRPLAPSNSKPGSGLSSYWSSQAGQGSQRSSNDAAQSRASARIQSWGVRSSQVHDGGREPESGSGSGQPRPSYTVDPATQSVSASMSTMTLSITASPRDALYPFPVRSGNKTFRAPQQPLQQYAYRDPSPAEQSTVNRPPPPTTNHSAPPLMQHDQFEDYRRPTSNPEITRGDPSTALTSQRAQNPPISHRAENRHPSPVPSMGAGPGPSSHGAPRTGQGSQSSSDHPAQPNASVRKGVPKHASTILRGETPEPRTSTRVRGEPSDASILLRDKSASPESQGNAKRQKK